MNTAYQEEGIYRRGVWVRFYVKENLNTENMILKGQENSRVYVH